MWMNPNNKGYIRATTISSEKFIIIGSQNIELSGNIIMKNGATLSSGLLNTNSIVPNETNSVSLGTSSKIWSNAYIKDLSINNNIEISGNTRINGILQASNIYTKTEIDNSFTNVYTKNQVYSKTEIDASLSNVYTNSLDVSANVTFRGSTLYVPSSFTIDPIGHEDNTGTVLINGNLVVQGVTTTINSSVVDISDKILVLASNATNSVHADGAGFEISGAKVNLLYNNSSNTFRTSIGMSISGNVVPSTNGVGSLGESGKIWSNAYIRDLSVTNIEISGNIVPFLDVSCNLGSSLNRWNNIFVNDLSVNNINGLPYSSGGGGGGGGGGGATDISINGVISISEPSETISKYIQIGRDLDGEYAHNGAFSGWSVSLNNTGDILAIGARRNNGDAVWPYGAGHVKIYKYIDASWIQLGEDINGTIPGEQLGYSVSLNNAGNIIAIGVPSFGPTYNGLVKLYIYNDVSWVQLGTNIVGEATGDLFGYVVSLNGIGNIVAIYAPSADGVNGANTGHTRIYKYIDNDWIKLGQDIDGTFESGNYEGELNANISLNTLGNIVAIGGGRANNNIGEVRVFKYNVDSWIQLGSNISGEGDFFGWSVSLNSTGNILAAGAVYNSGNGYASGHVRIYKYNDIDISWIQLGSDIDGEYEGNMSGHSVSLNDAGTIVAIGAKGNRGADSNYIWSGTGHVRVYKYNDVSWVQYGVDIDGEAAGDSFGQSVSLNSEGNILAVGAHTNDGNGNNSGSVRVYKFFDILVENKVISSNIVPFTNNIYTLGTSSLEWKNAYIKELNVNTINISGGNIININKLIAHTSNKKITTANRVYQEISGGSNWNAVNGYYGLAKQSFPALNPLTSGAKAIAYWTTRHNTGYFDFKNIVWAPKLKMFLTFSDGGYEGSGAKYSYDGINWINIFSGYALQWNVRALCWSDELGIFVAGSYRHPYVIYSYNGIEWYSNTTRDSAITFFSICWSPELGIFVAVTEGNITGTSTDGINWIGATVGDSPMKWGSVCWAPELGLFVATGIEWQNTNTKVMTSNDGYNWTLRTVPTTAEYPSWVSVCWSPQLGIFVTVASNGGGSNANIMTSTNGIDWIIRGNNNGYSYRNVSWCAELGLFLITQTSGGGSYLYSRNGIDWIEIYENISETGEWSSFNAYSVVRSPELGIFVAVGGNKIWTSVLKGRPPTSYNVFDSCFNRIDENGNWTFKQITMNNANIVDLSVNLINGQAYNAGGGGSIVLTSISGNIIPSTNNTYNLGSTTQFWKNAYINDICGGNIYSKTEVDSSLLTVLNTNHYTKQYGNSLWNQIGQDISFSSSILLAGISNNGRVVALTEPAYASNRGRLYIYEISFNGISYSWTPLGLSSEILVGLTTTGNFGADGNSVISLSSDGRVVAVNDTLNDTSETNSGQVRVFELSANVWRQRGQLINGKPIASYGLGYNIALSGNGNILAASSLTRPSPRNGEILVYEFSGNINSWIKMGQDISGVGGANFGDLGFSMSLSLDGTTLAAGYRSSTPSQVNIYRFNSSNRTWSLPIPTNNVINGSAIDQFFGWNIKLSSDGNTIVIGGIGYGTTIGNTSNGIGTVSVFKYNGTSWSQLGQTLYGVSANDQFGQWVQISNDGTIISAGGAISFLRVYKLYSNTWTQLGQVLNGFAGHALSGDGTTLVQVISKSGGNLSRVYGMDKLLTLNALFASSLTINNNIVPFVNNTSSLGTSAIRWSNIFTTNLNVNGTSYDSDDRLKHNEVIITNGLEIIDRLTPKFYQKTLTMLDASYNGDLSGHNWSYETGLIAQELLQISDLSFVVSGGDYYEESYIYKRRTNDPSNANYDISNANYDICYNLIPQTYNVNYNSIFVYGLAAIKELHAKVKSQETIINSLLTRIEALEANPNSS
jgi:hypothetical protein